MRTQRRPNTHGTPHAPREGMTPRRGLDRGMALLGAALLLVVAVVMPDAMLGLPAVVAAGLAFLGVVEIARRWWTQRAPHDAAHGRRGVLAAIAAAITGVAFLVLVHGHPERLAPVLAGVAVTLLLGLRLLATRAGLTTR